MGAIWAKIFVTTGFKSRPNDKKAQSDHTAYYLGID